MTEFTKPLPGATIDFRDPLSRGLIGCWPFNEGAGSRVADISGNRGHGATVAVDLTDAWVGSPHGGAFETDGVDDHILVASEGVTRFNRLITDAYSLSAWVISNDVSELRLVGGGQKSSGTRYTGLLQALGTGSEFVFRLEATGGQVSAASSEVQNNNQWYHLVGTYGAGDVSLYVDAVLKDTATTSGNVVDFDGVLFGEDIDLAGTRVWNGSFGNIRMYNRALGIEDIRRLKVTPFAGLLT